MDRLLRASSKLAAALCLAGVAVASQSAAAADASHGRSVFEAQCSACHSIRKGETLLGPSLFRVVGRRAGSLKGFAYSRAMKAASWNWTDDRLRSYLAAPKKVVPRTKMAFVGLKKPDQIDDVIAYLNTLK